MNDLSPPTTIASFATFTSSVALPFSARFFTYTSTGLLQSISVVPLTISAPVLARWSVDFATSLPSENTGIRFVSFVPAGTMHSMRSDIITGGTTHWGARKSNECIFTCPRHAVLLPAPFFNARSYTRREASSSEVTTSCLTSEKSYVLPETNLTPPAVDSVAPSDTLKTGVSLFNATSLSTM